ncbi:MAG: phosphate ABC transporter permease PstA [Clostridiales bacterium]|nr:phosphate ABC transporter permease PstA [Clostridiales bacterium]
MTVKIKRTNQSYKLTLKRHNERQAQKLIDHTSFLHLRVALLYKRTKFFIKYPFVKLGQFFVWLVVVCKLNVICRQLSELLDKNWRAESRQKAWYAFLKVSSFFAAFLGVLALVGLILFILIRGTPYVSWHFVFGKYTLDNPTLTPAIVGTLILVGIALCISIPIGVGSAIFLSEYARKAKGVKYIRLAIDSLAAIPSIVYGLFGFIFFVGLFGWSYSLLAGGVTLAIMTLPTVIRITEESLLTVPHIYREGSVALGASKVRTTFKVVLPCASVGIASALIQTVGRVISESAVLILTIGLMVNIVPDGVMSPGTSLALNIYYFGNFGSSDQAAATCVVLLIVVLLLNLVLSFVGKRLGRNNFKY